MPGRIKIRILGGRDLPVMDKSSDTTDAYVEIKMGNTTHKTEVYRKSLNPQWNSEWFKFEVEDAELQDGPLQMRVMDYDTYSANDSIGKVYIDLKPLLLHREGYPAMSGWVPIFDTMHGIRGEVNIHIKVDYSVDFSRTRPASCGVPFYYNPGIPAGFKVHTIHGFVEELVVNDDPEYQWIDKIRTPRASNEARQTLLLKLSGEVQRKMGGKVLDLGGNCVLGFKQCFDLEGESGIVVRGIGTAVTLVRCHHDHTSHHSPSPGRDLTKDVTSSIVEDSCLPPNNSNSQHQSNSPTNLSPTKQSPTKSGGSMFRRSSDSELTGKVNSASNSAEKESSHNRRSQSKNVMFYEGYEMLEYPFLSMTEFPVGFIVHLGGFVSASSIKLLEKMSNAGEVDVRDTWWTEIRMEMKSHCLAMGCNILVGYTETTSIRDDICLLHASGTAAIVNMNLSEQESILLSQPNPSPSEKKDWEAEREKDKDRPLRVDVNLANHHSQTKFKHSLEWLEEGSSHLACGLAHAPYSELCAPFPVTLTKCLVCKKMKVPSVLFTTIELPTYVATRGRGCLIQARVCKPKKDAKGETHARDVSDCLMILEYELHKQLLNKLKVKGMNAIFGLRVQICVGEKMMAAIATGTAVYLTALPSPTLPDITTPKQSLEQKVSQAQFMLHEAMVRNTRHFNVIPESQQQNGNRPSVVDDEILRIGTDLYNACKRTSILEIDCLEDLNIVTSVVDTLPPLGFETSNIQGVPGVPNLVCNLQMFTKVWRTKLNQSTFNSQAFSSGLDKVISSLYFRLRKMVPCALCNLTFSIDLPDEDDVQLTLFGIAVGIGDPSKVVNRNLGLTHKKSRSVGDPELTFPMDDANEDDIKTNSKRGASLTSSFLTPTPQAPPLIYHQPLRDKTGITLTPMAYIPGARIEQYLGNLSFFIIRESTSVKENGGLSGFVQNFISETLAIVRAHVAALGGNALVSYFMSHCVLMHNPHKNQGQCLINIGGDVVSAMFAPDLVPLTHHTRSASCLECFKLPRRSTTPKGSPKDLRSFSSLGSQGEPQLTACCG